MKHTEYIVPIGEEALDVDEIFIGVIRRQSELVRCKDCKWWQDKTAYRDYSICVDYGSSMDADDYCSRAERKEENGK